MSGKSMKGGKTPAHDPAMAKTMNVPKSAGREPVKAKLKHGGYQVKTGK